MLMPRFAIHEQALQSTVAVRPPVVQDSSPVPLAHVSCVSAWPPNRSFRPPLRCTFTCKCFGTTRRCLVGKPAETPKVGISRVCVKASPAFGRRRLLTNTDCFVFAHRGLFQEGEEGSYRKSRQNQLEFAERQGCDDARHVAFFPQGVDGRRLEVLVDAPCLMDRNLLSTPHW